MRALLRCVVTAAALAASGSAFAGSLADCHRPPPAWYTAPRISHTYTQVWGQGYGRGSTHEYSAQSRSSSRSASLYASQRYRDSSRRW
jgi:hypothetical protein